MAIELRLEKSGGAPWGFKLTGGADLEIPLTVVKISDGGPAHKAGLQIGDVILRVNEEDLADVSHYQAHDTIGQSGELMLLIIYRGELTDQQSLIISEEQSNEEVHNIMEGSIPVDYPERPYIEEGNVTSKEIDTVKTEMCIKHDLNLTDEEILSIINPEIVETTKMSSQTEKHAQIKIEQQQEIQTETTVQESAQQETVEFAQIQQEFSAQIEQQQEMYSETTVQQETIQDVHLQQQFSAQEEQEIIVQDEHEELNFGYSQQECLLDSSEVQVKQQEIENIAGKIVEEMSKIQQKQEAEEIRNVAEQIVEEITQNFEQKQQESVIWESQVKVQQKQIIQQSEVLKAVSGYLSDMEMESRKWSTFLQRPKGPKPILKVDVQPKKSTYKVVIRTKKDLEAAKKAAEEEAIREAEEAARAIEEEARAAEEAIRMKEEEARAAEEAERLAFEEAEARLLAEQEDEQQDTDINENVIDISREEEEEDDISRSEGTSKHMSGKEAVITVEQQLAQVKEQLLALSELPSTIQMTLSIITDQLKKLAQEAEAEPHTEDDELSNADNTETEDEVTELLVLESQEVLSIVEEESENFRIDSGLEAIAMEEEYVDVADTTIEDEEAEAKRLEDRRIAKIEKEKMQQQSQHPLAPLERPIILPGGRKWNQPNDAVRSVRQPKMSDDKIDETISSYYEVITGKTIGINFLKYQPPAKNLDHLQKSDVYKMVHDLEPPARGVTARPEKVPAVQDFLVKTNGEAGEQLPPQMER